MSDKTVDVVVVGAGPAGSMAAFKLAQSGIDVLVLEKRQEIGAPKRCAEGLSEDGLKRVGITPDPLWAVNKIYGTIVYTPSMKEVRISPKDMMGYILERKVFEKHLANQAIKAGAKYMIKTHVTDVIKEGDKVVGVKATHMGEEFSVKSKIVIAADGVDSMCAKRAGIDTLNHLKDYHSGFQYEMGGVNAQEDQLHIFVGNEKSPKGYIWIFPKGKGIANVGIGIVGAKSEQGARAKDLLDKFIAENPRFFAKASPIEMNSGGIPVSVSAKTFVGDGIMVVGDAAQQVNPIHGGGISLAMNAAVICAEVVAKAISEGDTGKDRLYEYEKTWRETDGKKMNRLFTLRQFIEKLDDNDLENLGDILSGDDVMDLVVKADTKKLLSTIIKKGPKMLSLAKKFL